MLKLVLIIITVSHLPKNYLCNDLLSELLWFSLPSWKLFKHWENTMCIHGELGSFLTYIKSHIQRQNLCKVSLGNVSIIIVFCLQTELKAADYHLMFKFPLCACEDVCECVECVHEYMCKWVCVWAYVWVTVWVCCVCAVWVCKWVSVCVTCAQVPTETRKDIKSPWNCCRQIWAAWPEYLEPTSGPLEEHKTSTCWTSSPTPGLLFYVLYVEASFPTSLFYVLFLLLMKLC